MNQQPKALRLADEYADAVATHRLESLYGTSKGYTLEKARERDAAHAALDAELRRLHAENESLKSELQEQARVNGMGGERELKLMAENEALRKDANRYRWLRTMIYDDQIIVAQNRMLHGNELDSAIDLAMKGQS